MNRHQPVEPLSSSSTKSPASMKCPDCDKLLHNGAAMAEHLKNPENKCPECRKHFLFEMDLRRHLELDHYSNNFQCPYCDKSFTAQTVYEKHVENHQSFDVHECEVCHVRFTGFATLTRHITHAHPEYNATATAQSEENPEIFGL